MAEEKAKSVAGLKQAEINIIEEKLSSTHGILPREIATALSNRFDKILEEINKVTSELIYTDKIQDRKKRQEKIADINRRKNELRKERDSKISGWNQKVMKYIIEVYGPAKQDPNGIIMQYGERLEVLPNKHLKKFY